MSYKNSEDKNANQRRRYNSKRLQAIEALGGVCVLCGSSEGLQFDHIDPTQKEFSIYKVYDMPSK